MIFFFYLFKLFTIAIYLRFQAVIQGQMYMHESKDQNSHDNYSG